MIQKWLGAVKGREAVRKAYEAIGQGEEQYEDIICGKQHVEV